MPNDQFLIRPLNTMQDLDDAIALFEAYAGSLSVDLSYQGFAAELEGLPGPYAPPGGTLLLAFDRDGEPLGCVALRPMRAEGCCEMKRLYGAPEGRGMGIGRALAEAVIGEAQWMGYREIRLDTLPDMAQAISLYRSLGFRPIDPYYDTPVAGTVFLAKDLST